MITIYSENFNSYSTGVLWANDGWLQVYQQGDAYHEARTPAIPGGTGTKAVYGTFPNTGAGAMVDGHYINDGTHEAYGEFTISWLVQVDGNPTLLDLCGMNATSSGTSAWWLDFSTTSGVVFNDSAGAHVLSGTGFPSGSLWTGSKRFKVETGVTGDLRVTADNVEVYSAVGTALMPTSDMLQIYTVKKTASAAGTDASIFGNVLVEVPGTPPPPPPFPSFYYP